MHSGAKVAEALRLHSEGASSAEISLALQVPFGTVRDWCAGKLPRSYFVGPGGLGECPSCNGSAHDFGSLPSAYVYLLGIYLGDGYISMGPRGVARLRIALDKRYPDIVAECERALSEVLPLNRVGRRATKDNCIELSSYSKVWPCLFPQHGPGKKHEREIVLVPWQEDLVTVRADLLVRGLIHSDGCRFNNGPRGVVAPRYNFRNRSDGIRAIFCRACDQLGISWTQSGNETIYVSRKADVAALDQFVGPKT